MRTLIDFFKRVFANEYFMTLFPYIIIAILLYASYFWFLKTLKRIPAQILKGIKNLGKKVGKAAKKKKKNDAPDASGGS